MPRPDKQTQYDLRTQDKDTEINLISITSNEQLDESKNAIPFTLKKAKYLVINLARHLQGVQAANHKVPARETKGLCERGARRVGGARGAGVGCPQVGVRVQCDSYSMSGYFLTDTDKIIMKLIRSGKGTEIAKNNFEKEE